MTKSAVDSVAVLTLAFAERKRENERLRERLARMTAIARERSEALNFADGHIPAWHAIRDERDLLRTKVKAIEALADEWDAWTPGTVSPPATMAAYAHGVRTCSEALRTAMSED